MTLFDQHSAPRIEAGLKVTGAACYAAETPIEGILHAALVEAPIASGRVLSIDTGCARSIPGVVDILTHETALRISRPGFLNLLQEPVVYFAGQPVAVAVAETLGQARLAAGLVEVAYEKTTSVTSLAQGLEQAFAPKTAGRTATDSRRGDPEGGLREADIAIERRYTTATNNHLPLEPHAVIAVWGQEVDGESLTVHTCSQAIFAHRLAIANCFGLPAERVRVVSKYLGGGFGSKGGAWFPCLVLGIMVARQIGRPVKLELTRAQMFTLVGRRQETIQRLKLGATREGRLTALVHDTVAQTSAYGDYADPVATPTRMLYACPNVATTHRLVRVERATAQSGTRAWRRPWQLRPGIGTR